MGKRKRTLRPATRSSSTPYSVDPLSPACLWAILSASLYLMKMMRLPAQRMVHTERHAHNIPFRTYDALFNSGSYPPHTKHIRMYIPRVWERDLAFDWLYKGIVWRFIRDDLSPSVMLFLHIWDLAKSLRGKQHSREAVCQGSVEDIWSTTGCLGKREKDIFFIRQELCTNGAATGGFTRHLRISLGLVFLRKKTLAEVKSIPPHSVDVYGIWR